ncbi:hypothetical protein XAP7430_990090 [Xanthomonas phaseoli pv. phaseoli]|uniref:Uncharacterized protein n=1 Tax=Xanthomonas campestris pv. phaseoli TaxID=317013 RepID=A0AB38E7F5_XANCH|nr:hypothetical protein XAP6984_1000089 [Xanthomonas phaseoli pv. phaseoli]SON93285.1 hypothetical protein XAP7430_990090 [Xanthomonas phaseoli pv. phaseoli]
MHLQQMEGATPSLPRQLTSRQEPIQSVPLSRFYNQASAEKVVLLRLSAIVGDCARFRLSIVRGDTHAWECHTWRHLKDVEAELPRRRRMYAELALIITRSRTSCRERSSQTR